MPMGDGTGPRWAGCNAGCFGRRGVLGPWFAQGFSKEEEKQVLTERVHFLENELESIKKRISELSA
ncbi:MAG: DUF5320 domain-containing protein [Candidatus Micrarchaeota archaeon]